MKNPQRYLRNANNLLCLLCACECLCVVFYFFCSVMFRQSLCIFCCFQHCFPFPPPLSYSLLLSSACRINIMLIFMIFIMFHYVAFYDSCGTERKRERQRGPHTWPGHISAVCGCGCESADAYADTQCTQFVSVLIYGMFTLLFPPRFFLFPSPSPFPFPCLLLLFPLFLLLLLLAVVIYFWAFA